MGIEGKTTEKDIKKQSLLEVTAWLSVVPPGIEPGTQGFSVLCSTNWAMAPAFLITGAKIEGFFKLTKYMSTFFQKNHVIPSFRLFIWQYDKK